MRIIPIGGESELVTRLLMAGLHGVIAERKAAEPDKGNSVELLKTIQAAFARKNDFKVSDIVRVKPEFFDTIKCDSCPPDIMAIVLDVLDKPVIGTETIEEGARLTLRLAVACPDGSFNIRLCEAAMWEPHPLGSIASAAGEPETAEPPAAPTGGEQPAPPPAAETAGMATTAGL